MTARLEVTNEQFCRGCHLCCLAWARIKSGTISLAEVPVRVQRDGQKFFITLEGVVGEEGNLLVQRCPRHCFSLTHAG